MRQIPIRNVLVCFALLVGWLAGLSTLACTSAVVQPGRESPSAVPTLVFDNGTIDPVTVYIEHAGSQQVLGHVEPRRRAQLRIPDFGSLRGAADLRVIVVPLGTARNRHGAHDSATAIYSEFEPADQLIGMVWSLNGRTLVSVAFPRGRR
jgi:hypothetical protein